VVIPANVTPAKIEGISALGATALCEGVTFDNRETIAEKLAATEGWRLIHPYDDWDIIHGAGTVGLEILEDMPHAGAIVVPVGGGGQISGVALAVAALSPHTTVIGVEPAGADDAARSLRTGALQSLSSDPITLAEGVKCKAIGERNFEVMVAHGLVDDIVTVTDNELAAALRTCWTTLKLAIEPTAALGLAAYLGGKVPAGSAERPTVISLSGGNFDAPTVADLLVG
jgi:threonine dehydratase